ncbi:thioredoxin-like domain-containing protein [Siphonobacter sp.]|uniref:thioredoxin-like domain-containing protein n=1 Tax=Siphonobacter sp. TaxID=1869184 RepID=UPI003B3BCB66
MYVWVLHFFLLWLGPSNAQPPAGKLRVLLFTDTECPICQKITPRVQKLADEYQGSVSFELIYPTAQLKESEVKAFQHEYKLSLPHRLDPKHQFVRRYKVTTTPEVVLLSATNQVLYQGSIDDQFYQLGSYRIAPQRHYLKEALEYSLQGKPVPLAYTKAVGCLIND